MKIGFVLAKKVGWGRLAGFSMGAVYMAAALAGCRKALVSTGWSIVSTNRLRNHSRPLVTTPFLDV